MKKSSTLFIFLSLAAALNAYAEAPNLLTYQGRLKESGQAVTGNRAVEIFLCDAQTGPTCHTSGAQSVAVSNGLFRSTFSIPATANFGAGSWWLEIKVGADTLAPRERLTSNAYALLAGTAAYASNIAAAEGAAGVYISSNLYVTGNEFSVGGSTLGVRQGKVGIGTLTPSGYLEIYAAGSGQTHLVLNNPSSDVGLFIKKTSKRGILAMPYYDDRVVLSNKSAPFPGAFDPALTLWDAGHIDLKVPATGYIRLSDGNVGISSSTPLYRLVISSGAGESGNMVVISTGSSNVIRMTGAGEIYANIYYGDGSALSGITATSYTGTLPVANGGTGATTLTGVIKGNGTGAFSAMTGTANRGVRWADANTIAASALITDNGTNVGIGAALPDQELTVAGDISQTGVLISSGTGDNYFAGRVGIGTDTPGSQLHLAGAGAVTQNIESQAAATVQLNLLNTAAAWNFIVDSLDSSKLKIARGGATKITLDATNVGIGTDTPGSKLDVNGEINAGGGLCLGGNCKSSWPFSPGSQALEMGAYVINSSSHITAAAYQINGSTVLAFKPASFSFMAGQDAGRLTTGVHGTFVGTKAGYNNTTGQENTFVGSNAGQNNSIGEANTALGYFSGYNMTGKNNTFIGRGAGFYSSTEWDNTFVGKNAGLFNAGGGANVVLGADAAYGDTGSSFSSSTLIGFGAGYNMLTGVGNIFIGYKAGYIVETGTGNIIIGFEKDAPTAGTNSYLNIGGAIFGNLITGNIGIGTPSPRSRLDVWGASSLYLGQTGFAHGIVNSDDSMMLVVDANNDANNAFLEVGTGGGAPLLYIVQPGVVGVGTSNPMAALDVKSTGTLVTQYAQIWRNSGSTVIASMTATGVFNVAGDIRLNAAGSGLQVAEGANARMGTVNLTAGTATVANTSVTANTRIFLTIQSVSGTLGIPYVDGRVAGTSFTITSTNSSDTSTIAWLLIEP